MKGRTRWREQMHRFRMRYRHPSKSVLQEEAQPLLLVVSTSLFKSWLSRQECACTAFSNEADL